MTKLILFLALPLSWPTPAEPPEQQYVPRPAVNVAETNSLRMRKRREFDRYSLLRR